MTSRENKLIKRLVEELKTKYGRDTSGHDWMHLERVRHMAKKLAGREKVNHFVLEMAALLHDVDDYKFKPAGEGELSQTTAILNRLGVGGEERETILDIVAHVSYKGALVPTLQKTLEGKIVQDADRLDAMGAIGIARTFAYNGHKGNALFDPLIKPRQGDDFATYKRQKSTAINHFYEKLLLLKDRLNTSQAKRLAVKRHQFLKDYLREFFRELDEAK